MSVPARQALSEAEAGIWRLQALVENAACLWIAEAIQIEGNIDPVVFETALRDEIETIASLNHCYADRGDGPRKYPRPTAGWALAKFDLVGANDPMGMAQERMRDLLLDAPGLDTGPVFRLALFRLRGDRWLWFQSYHHIAMDGVGMRQVAARVAGTYSRLMQPARAFPDRPIEPGPPSPGIPARATQASAAYWNDLLEDWAGPIQLAGRVGPPTQVAIVERVRMPDPVTARLRVTARSGGAPLHHVLVAAAGLWLNTVAGSTDVVVGLTVRGRMREDGNTPAMMANFIPLRLQIAAHSTLLTLVREVHRQRRGSRPHELHRASGVLRALGMPAAMGFGPTVNIMPLDYRMTFGGHSCSARNIAIGPVSDLCLSVFDRNDGLGPRIELAGNPDLYTADRLRTLARRLERLLVVLARSPERQAADIDLLGPSERELVLGPWSGVRRPVRLASIAELFADQARMRPLAPCLSHGETWITYGELPAAAKALADEVVRAFAGGVVAIVLPRTPEYFVALLAISITGKAFAAIDPANPRERIGAMIEDSGACGVVTSSALRPVLPPGSALLLADRDWPADIGVELMPCRPAPDALAYVMFTSGSTGRPKAVGVPQRGLASLAAYQAAHLCLNASSRILQFASPGFDAIIMELLMALGIGACLEQPLDDERLGPALGRFITRRGVTHALLPPTALLGLDPATQHSPATLVIGGEACSAAQAARWAVGRRLINAYGPTEATICSTMSQPLTGDGQPPIGRPVWNTQVYILDPFGRPTPPGTIGELHIAGDGVALGYLNDVAATGRGFVPCAFGKSGRMFRTGDRVCFHPDGTIAYFGRADRQVKLRGIRIDPGEVEAALSLIPGVGQAVVASRSDDGGRMRLIGYVVPVPGAVIDPPALRRALAVHLPPAMIPAVFVMLDRLPLNAGGKVDHRRLPLAPKDRGRPERATGGERQLAALFAEALEQDTIAVEDDFFALGGDSLAATVLIQRINDVMGSHLTIADLFRHPDAGALAAQIANRGAPSISPFSVLLGFRVGTARAALFCIHTGSGLGWAYSALLPHLDPALPVYALQARGLDGRAPLAADLEALAQDYVAEMRHVQPHGPYHLLGWSSGGPLAHLVATRLQDIGEAVGLLVSLDGYPAGPLYERGVPPVEQRQAARDDLRRAIEVYLEAAETNLVDRRDVLDEEALGRMIDIHVNTGRLLAGGRLGVFRGDLLLFTCGEPYGPDAMPPPQSWSAFVTGRVEAIEIACHHDAMLLPGPARFIGAMLAKRFGALS